MRYSTITRKMISMEKAEGIEEVFVVRNESIDFLGALVKAGGGNWTVRGRVRFYDGETLAFHHRSGDYEASRKKLVYISKAIAGFYGTNYFGQKFEEAIWLRGSSDAVHDAGFKLN